MPRSIEAYETVLQNAFAESVDEKTKKKKKTMMEIGERIIIGVQEKTFHPIHFAAAGPHPDPLEPLHLALPAFSHFPFVFRPNPHVLKSHSTSKERPGRQINQMNDPGESEGLRKRVPDNAASATAPSPLDEPSSNSSAVGTGIGPVVYVQADPDNLRGGATAGAPINGTVSGPTSSTSPSPNKLNCLNNKVLIRSLVVGFIISLVLTAIVVGFWFSWKSGPASVDQTDFNYLNTTEEEAGACLLGLRNDTGYDAKILFYFTFGQGVCSLERELRSS